MSKAFDSEADWAEYESFLPASEVAKAIKLAVEFTEEPLMAVIPSLVMLPDGPKLETIFFATPNYLSEVDTDGKRFDFVRRQKVFRIVWSFGTFDVKDAEGKVTGKLETITLKLAHDGVNESTLSYVGSSPETWIARVRRCLPTELLNYS